MFWNNGFSFTSSKVNKAKATKRFQVLEHWLWHSWQSNAFKTSNPQFESSHRHFFIFCPTDWNENKEKRGRDLPFLIEKELNAIQANLQLLTELGSVWSSLVEGGEGLYLPKW